MTNSNINRAKKLIQGRQHNGQYIPCFKRVWYSFEQINPETNQTCKSLILLINRENAKSTINEILSRINSFISMPFFSSQGYIFFLLYNPYRQNNHGCQDLHMCLWSVYGIFCVHGCFMKRV